MYTVPACSNSTNWQNLQIPQCPPPPSISHNAPFRTEMCTFLFWMVLCGIWNRCLDWFVRWVYSLSHGICRDQDDGHNSDFGIVLYKTYEFKLIAIAFYEAYQWHVRNNSVDLLGRKRDKPKFKILNIPFDWRVISKLMFTKTRDNSCDSSVFFFTHIPSDPTMAIAVPNMI